MKLFAFFYLVSFSAFASAPTVCQVIEADLKTGASSVVGNFEAELGEEELTTKSFEVKSIKQVVTARVYFTDEFVGIKWGDDGAVNDVSTTVRIDVDKKAKTGEFPAGGAGTQTRVILSDWNNLKAADICKKALNDKAYAASIAEGGNLPILLDSCQAYLDNDSTNTMIVSKTVKGKEFRLVCTESK